MYMLNYCFAELANEAQAEAYFIGSIFLALTKSPSDELGKASLCKSEGNPSRPNHACKRIYLAGICWYSV
jgi:hypothetical protein